MTSISRSSLDNKKIKIHRNPSNVHKVMTLCANSGTLGGVKG